LVLNLFDRLFRRRQSAKIISLNAWLNEDPHYSVVSFESMVRHGYHKNELIYACVSKKANTAAQIGLSVSNSPDDDPDPQHPLKQLIQKPNPYMSEFDLWAAVCIYQALAGRAIFEKERSRAGQVVRLWPLRPDWVKPVAQGNLVMAYEYQPPGVQKIIIDANDVVDFKLFDPLGQFSTWPPVAVAARVGDADNGATDHIKLIWEHGGIPMGYIKSTQNLLQPAIDSIQNQFIQRYGGHENWLKPMVLGQDADYQKLGLSFSELGFDILDARSEARICLVFDVPPILVGAKIGLDRATYSNYGEARRAWWQDTLIPMYESYLDTIQNQLGSEFGNPTIDWDFASVPALQEERNGRWTRATTAIQAGAITVNEFCFEVGLADKGKAGEVYLRGFSTVEVPAKTGVRELVTPDTTQPGGKSAKAKNPPDQETRLKHEKSMAKVVVTFLDGQLKRIQKTLNKKALSDIGTDFWDAEDDAFFQAMFPELFQAAIAGSESALAGLAAMGIGVDWALVNQAVVAWAKKYGYDLVKGIDNTTQKLLQTAVSDWISSGQPLDDLITTLAPSFGAVRAEMIGVTEVTRAFAVGNQATWKETGMVSGQKWMTGRDEIVCPLCGELDGQVFSLDDTEHTPPYHTRCRCYLQPVVEAP
jgi:HK97 family phage portal protein